MTGHADVEVYLSKTFSTNPADTTVDKWCTDCDALITQMGSGLSTTIKTFLAVQGAIELYKQYKKWVLNAGADATGDKDGAFTYNVVDLIKFLKGMILALETCGDHLTIEVPGNT